MFSGLGRVQMKRHVLIADEDEMVQSMVSFLVTDRLGMRATLVGTGKEMHAVLKADTVDLVMLDLSLPDENGLVLVRQIRARSDIPVIVLTKDNSKEMRIAALEIGISDFVQKPFDPYELQLRIKNQLRNQKTDQVNLKTKLGNQFKFGKYVLDIERRSLNTIDGRRVHLTPNEFNILSALVQRKNKVMSRSQILDVIDNGDDAPSDRAIDVYISQIRKKIEKNATQPKIIQAVRGYGYIFVQESS